MLNKKRLVSASSCLLLLPILFQSCTTSQSTTAQAPVFHFGESPCLEMVDQKSISTSKLGRPIVKRAFPQNLSNVKGSIVMTISIDREGNVVYAQYMPELSTIKDQKTIMSTLEAMSKTTFAVDHKRRSMSADFGQSS